MSWKAKQFNEFMKLVKEDRHNTCVRYVEPTINVLWGTIHQIKIDNYLTVQVTTQTPKELFQSVSQKMLAGYGQ